MKVSVNLNAIDPPLEELVYSKLDKNNLPRCIGSMLLPLLKSVEEFDGSDILAVKDGKKDQLLVDSDLKNIILSPSLDSIPDLSLTIDGLKKLIDFKEAKAVKFADQCFQCVSCPYIDICYKLTQNTLKLIIALKKKEN